MRSPFLPGRLICGSLKASAKLKRKQKGGNRSPVAVNYFQCSGNCTPDTRPNNISSRKCWVRFHYFVFSTEVLQPNLVCRGKKSRETIIMVQMLFKVCRKWCSWWNSREKYQWQAEIKPASSSVLPTSPVFFINQVIAFLLIVWQFLQSHLKWHHMNSRTAVEHCICKPV